MCKTILALVKETVQFLGVVITKPRKKVIFKRSALQYNRALTSKKFCNKQKHLEVGLTLFSSFTV